jgi:PAS domain S-box-containing protein
MTTNVERDWAEEARLNERRLEALLTLNQMTEAPLQQITDFALEQAVALTRSKIGYLAFMNEDERVLVMHSWSKEAMAECAIANKRWVYPLDTTGLWGEAARQRKPVITNDYRAWNSLKKGIPEGHVALIRHMNVPILDGGQIVIVAGVGNKPTDYDESDVRQITLLMEGMWGLIQRQRAQEELRKHHEHLEQLIHDRTAALVAANEALHQSHAELKAIYDGMADGVLVADKQTKWFLGVNPAICRMLGYSEEELLSMSVSDIHPRQSVPWVLDRFQAEGEGRLPVNDNCPVLRKDGTVFYADIACGPIVYNGRPCVVGLFHDITERKKADEALRQEQRILRRLLESSEHERQLVSYEIHDGLAQLLAAALMQLELNEKENDPRLAGSAYDLAVQMIRESHAEARRLIRGLRPLQLDDAGVVPAIQSLVEEANRQGEPEIELHSDLPLARFEPLLENTIFRIVQECVTNACRHSKSRKVRIDLAEQGDQLRIEVEDWGVGFDLRHAGKGHFGLEGIQERARAFGGHAVINSGPGKGTDVIVEIPLHGSSATV